MCCRARWLRQSCVKRPRKNLLLPNLPNGEGNVPRSTFKRMSYVSLSRKAVLDISVHSSRAYRSLVAMIQMITAESAVILKKTHKGEEILHAPTSPLAEPSSSIRPPPVSSTSSAPFSEGALPQAKKARVSPPKARTPPPASEKVQEVRFFASYSHSLSSLIHRSFLSLFYFSIRS